MASPALLSGGPADLNFRHVTMGIRSRDTICSKPQATKISLMQIMGKTFSERESRHVSLG